MSQSAQKRPGVKSSSPCLSDFFGDNFLVVSLGVSLLSGLGDPNGAIGLFGIAH